ncbi:MAG: DUF1801 domain-containing protein [Saprospiraceae bacterium]
MAKTDYQSVDEYIRAQSVDKQKVLKILRKLIKITAPQAEELISYQIPMYKQNGMLVGFAAYKDHFSFTTANATTLAKFKEELEGFRFSVSTVQFLPDKPIPNAILKKIIETRIKENKEITDLKKAKKK